MRSLLFLVVLAALSGCASQPSFPPGDPLPALFIHRFNNPPDPDHFQVGQDADLVDVRVFLANFYRAKCPAPIAEIKVVDPSGATFAHLQTQNLPAQDCAYEFTKNATTLAPGRWTIQYSGGSEFIGSRVEVKPHNVTAST